MLRNTLSALALLGLAACASPGAQEASAAPAGDRDCFNASTVQGYNVIDNRHVAVRVGANRTYILTTMWNSHDLDWSEAIALHSTNGYICTGNGLGVEVTGGRPQQTYPITSVARAPEPAPQAS